MWCDFYALCNKNTKAAAASWSAATAKKNSSIQSNALIYGNGLMMLTLDNRKTASTGTGTGTRFLGQELESFVECRNTWVFDTPNVCAEGESETAALMMDFLRIGSIPFYTLDGFLPFISMMSEREGKRNVQMESIFEVSTTTWFNGHDFSRDFVDVFPLLSFTDHCLEFQMSLAWSSKFTKSFSPLKTITTVLCMSHSHVCVNLIYLNGRHNVFEM